ncbi:hypothetical protein UFOVP273_6 [uncultured Caudovirales phage]|uniref:Uncharacterized protein n=1 Tax=uncultured Caudovirales phage TaxID=2100421 RepID=A0A6J5LLV9_9CAUD|nr:hypothetical protein UFOVP273_6 [uncultured Caudovirales phage]
MEYPIKTGEVYYRDENGALYLAESWITELGEVYTTDTLVQE